MNALNTVSTSRLRGAWLLRLLVTGTALLGFVACGDDDTGKPSDTTLDVNFDGIDVPDTVDGSQPDSINPNLVKVFDFKKAIGDDGKPCLNQPRCSVFLGYSEQLPLEMVYTEDGDPVMDKTVTFTVESDPNNLGRLNINSVVSDAAGVARVTVSPRVNQVGQFAVKATMPGTDLPAKTFDIVISPKGLVPLTVVGTYNGQRQVGSYSVRLYKQTTAGEPKCTGIDKGLDPDTNIALPTANYGRDNILRQQTAKFPEFLGLDTDGTQKYTILVFSRNTNSAVQAIGCDSDNGSVNKNESRTVSVEMLDRPPTYVGAYRLTSEFNFVSAIPQPYRRYVDYVFEVFRSPTSGVFTIVCDLTSGPGGQLNDFCSALFTRINGELVPSAVAGFAIDLLDSILYAVLDDTAVGTVLQVGRDVADIVKEFEIGATLQITAEPGQDGRFPVGSVTEQWDFVTVRWTLNQNCTPGVDIGCGVRTFGLPGVTGGVAGGAVPASVANEFELTIDQHALALRYGALIDYMVQEIIIPALIGQASVNTYEELIGYFIGGGIQCVTADNCCQSFALQITDGNTNTLLYRTLVEACDTLLPTLTTFLSNAVKNLELSGEGFSIGTKPLKPCLMRDANDDFVIDTIGTPGNPCEWNILLKFSDTSSTTIDAKFWGSRAE